MRRTELRILDILRDGPLTVTRLAERLEKNQGWISELVADLEEQTRREAPTDRTRGHLRIPVAAGTLRYIRPQYYTRRKERGGPPLASLGAENSL